MKFNKIFWIELTDHVVDYVFWPNKNGLRDFKDTQSLLESLKVPIADIYYFSLDIEVKNWPNKAEFPEEVDYEWNLSEIWGELVDEIVKLDYKTQYQLGICLLEEIEATVVEELK